jgi:hypothetical protein
MERLVDFPHEWGTGEPIEHVAYKKDDLRIFGVLLDDGSNLFTLIYPGGERFVRTAADNDWGIEERYQGKPPRPRDLAVVNREWRTIIDMIVTAGRRVSSEMLEMGYDVPLRRRDG